MSDDRAHILLVQPPVQHPASDAPAIARAEAALIAHGYAPVRFNAAREFILDYLMAPSVQTRLVSRVRERWQRGDFGNCDPGTRQRIQMIATPSAPAATVQQQPTAWRPALPAEDGCSDLSQMVGRLGFLDRVLAVASAACYPAAIDRCGFNCPGLDDEAALEAFLNDPLRNPFLGYARQSDLPALPTDRCATAVMVAAIPGQLVGALTLARCWKARRPGLAVAVCAARQDLGGAAARMCGPSLDLAAARAAAIVQTAIAVTEAAPDVESQGWGFAAGEVMVCSLDPARPPSFLETPAQGEGRVVVWHTPVGSKAEISRLLFRSAKAGCWNHLTLAVQDDPDLAASLQQFADENPYIIHSWCRREPPASKYGDGLCQFPQHSTAYGATRPMPGRPVWMRLQDPVYLQKCVGAHGARHVARQRLDEGDRLLPLLGSRLVYHYLPPDRLPPGYLDEIIRMVEAGGTVGSQWLRHNLERAFLIGYAEEHGLIAGNSSLKRPREEYLAAVSAQCGIDLRNYLERGYTSVRPEYRSLGIGARLLEGLTERAGEYKVYSVIAEDNVATQKMAIRNRTRRVASFFSERTGKQIGIWIPEWMLPEGIELPRQPDPS